MTRMIEEGDSVLIHLDALGKSTVFGTVLHTPAATGDAWCIKQHADDLIVNVQQYHAMWKQP